MNLSATFATLISISAAAAQTTTPDDESMLLIQSLGLKDDLPKPGYNMEGGSIFDNYFKAQRDGQFFLVLEGIFQFEEPSTEPTQAAFLQWCSNLHFIGGSNGTSITRGVGYTAQCVGSFLGDKAETYAQMNASGAEFTYDVLAADKFSSSQSLSAIYNAHSNMFNMANHNNADNYIGLYSDTGLSAMPALAWETHDDGDISPNADTSSLSATGQMTWVSTEDAALFLNINATDFTPAKFDEVYEKVWNDHHAYAEAQQTTTDTNDSSTNEEEEESDAETDGSSGNDGGSETTEDTEEESESNSIEEDDESSASNGRCLFVAILSMFSTILGSSV